MKKIKQSGSYLSMENLDLGNEPEKDISDEEKLNDTEKNGKDPYFAN